MVPSKDEELTIEKFIDWAKEGIKRLKINGEIILADRSCDNTKLLALQKGVKVIDVPKDGLGFAYEYARKFVSGKYVILGDADCTYDFRDLDKFYFELKSGKEFVMGTRLKGSIEKGSMPFHHRYFGTPLTTLVLAKFLRLPFSDIHCGMRGISKNLLLKLPFNEKGWEYAPEMIVEACRISNKVSEVPINFYKSDSLRKSHFKRGKFSFLAPFKAGLGSFRVTFLHAADKLLRMFGISLIVTGGIGGLVLAVGPVYLGNFRVSIISQSICVVIFSYGVLSLIISNFLKMLFTENKMELKKQIRKFSFNKIFILMIIFLTCSFIYLISLAQIIVLNYTKFEENYELYIRILNFLLLIDNLLFISFIYSLLINYLNRKLLNNQEETQ